ncbi:hypothetical protein [uncultured Kordia sp.]|uniref:hypothetical protein n=1 Tax=uncultured Kordia sp. TaxID=507699 RepID=UPI002632469E|nr:hypothetical protein [uncultured Kordia sp.]
MSENVQNNPETSPKSHNEVDLGELFRMIGNAINKLFRFIRNILLIVFDLIIKVLIIIRIHIIKFTIAGVLSLVIGWFIDSKKPPIYSSSMVVNTNYGSSRQFYSNIRYYNNLAEDGKSETLAKIFGIDEDEAKTLAGFYIEPSVTENDILKSYNEFMVQADTAIVKDQIDFEKYKRSIDPLDYKSHKVIIASLQQDIFRELQDSLITHNVENEYVRRFKDIRLRNIDAEEKMLEKRMVIVDTLRNVYNKSILSESQKTSSSQTNIQLSSSTVKTNEIELFDLDEKISQKILELKEKKEFGVNTVEVLNDFTPGSEVKRFFDRFIFKVPAIILTLLLLFILVRELNRYLNTYEEKKRLNV